MVNAIGKICSYIYSPVESILKKGLSHYIFDKLQERNPLQSSPGYHEEVKALTKNIVILKAIKKQLSIKPNQQSNHVLQDKLRKLHHRIACLNSKLNHLKRQEQDLRFFKWVGPCNLIIPGSGDVIRVAAYTFKVYYGIKQYFRYKSYTELRQATTEIAQSRIVSIVTQIVYDTMHSLKQYMTYPNFRAWFYY